MTGRRRRQAIRHDDQLGRCRGKDEAAAARSAGGAGQADPADVREFLDEYLTSDEFAMQDCAAFLRRDELYERVSAA